MRRLRSGPGGRAIFDVFRYADGWMLKQRGDPRPGVVLSTRERAIELGAAIAGRHAVADLIIRDASGHIDETHRLGRRARAQVGALEGVVPPRTVIGDGGSGAGAA